MMVISQGKYTMWILEQKHIDETAWMIAESFTTMNPLWKAFKVDVNEAFSFIRSKLITCAILPMSHVFFFVK